MRRMTLVIALLALVLAGCSGNRAADGKGATVAPGATAAATQAAPDVTEAAEATATPEASAPEATEPASPASSEAPASPASSEAPASPEATTSSATAPAGAGETAEFLFDGALRVFYPATADLYEKDDGATISRIEGENIGAVIFTPVSDIEDGSDAFLANAENIEIMKKSWLENYDNAKLVTSGKTSIGRDIPALQVAFTGEIDGDTFDLTAYAFVFNGRLYQVMTMSTQKNEDMAGFVRDVMGTMELGKAG